MADGGRELLSRNLSTIEMRSIDWLWRGWIPKGYITVWAGETGAGKSTVLADIAARVTTGAPWPGEGDAREPGRVLWLGSEDGVEEMTAPRLKACGANLENVDEIQGVLQKGKRNSFSMQDDIEAVGTFLERAQAEAMPYVMLVIDPVTSYLSGQRLRKVDINDAGQLRNVLEPWLGFAQKYMLAIVCVTHFAKDTTRAMLHRVLGSAAFAQTSRSLCSVIARPDDGQFAKALVQVKVNLPDHPGGSWKFETEKVQVGIDARNGRPIEATRPSWIELDSLLTPEALVGKERGPVSGRPIAFGLWLRGYFMSTPTDQGLLVSQVMNAAIQEGVVSRSWWDEHSGEHLDKQNIGGQWYCRPKAAGGV
jgi:RecA/RadA recombinase